MIMVGDGEGVIKKLEEVFKKLEEVFKKLEEVFKKKFLSCLGGVY